MFPQINYKQLKATFLIVDHKHKMVYEIDANVWDFAESVKSRFNNIDRVFGRLTRQGTFHTNSMTIINKNIVTTIDNELSKTIREYRLREELETYRDSLEEQWVGEKQKYGRFVKSNLKRKQ